MSLFKIPITPQVPWIEFSTTLDGNSYYLTLRWNSTAEKWFMDIRGITTTLTLNGICLLTGIDLLAPYGIRQLGSMRVVDTQKQKQDPTFTSLGDQHILIYISKE